MERESKFLCIPCVVAILLAVWTTTCHRVEFDQTPKVDRVQIRFESNYEPIPAEYAKLFVWGPESVDGELMNREDGAFVYEIPVVIGENYIFNIATNHYPICDPKDDQHLAFYNGIRAKEVRINEKVMDESFLFYNLEEDGSNFIFQIAPNGDIVPGMGKKRTINESIPPEIWFTSQTVKYPGSYIANKYANAWFSAIHNTKKGGVSSVEIESFRFFARLSNGQDVLLASEDYTTSWEGKLYIRYPYFICSLDPQFQWPMPAKLESGKLVFHPSEAKNRVWHGWCLGEWPRVPGNALSLWIDAEVRITGNALIQFGVDFRPSLHSNADWDEYGLSDWFFETEHFQKIYFNEP